MHPIDPMLQRSAARAHTIELPTALADAIESVWAEVEALVPSTLDAAYERFTAALPVVPHVWADRYIALTPGTSLEPGSILRLALLTLGELGTTDARSHEARVETQPWFRGYQLLADALRSREHLAALERPLRWLAVDALLDACDLDGRVNSMQEATGHLWTCWAIEHEAGLDPEPTLQRLWLLAARGFDADGYDDGSYDLTFARVAMDIDDPGLSTQLGLIHALLVYATVPWEAYARDDLRSALEDARAQALDVEGLRDLCLPIIGGYHDGELPVRAEDV